MQGVPDLQRDHVLRPGWSSQRVPNCLQHKGRRTADPYMDGFGKTHGPGEKETTEKKRVRSCQVRQGLCFQTAQAHLFLLAFACGARDAQSLSK